MKIIFFYFAICLWLLLGENINFEKKFITQKIDNFNKSDLRTYQQKYYISSHFLNPEAKDTPIFFYIGGENAIEGSLSLRFFSEYLPKKFNGLIVLAEHRYYGESFPFPKGDKSEEALKYLVSDQALEDNANLIRNIRLEFNFPNNFLLVGGSSYSGSLSAYMRMKYSDIVQGSLASAAPIIDFVGANNPFKYYEAITNNFKEVGCANEIQKGFTLLRTFFLKNKMPKSFLETIKNELNLCKIPTSEIEFTNQLYGWLLSSYLDISLFNYNFKGIMEPWPLNKSCEALNKTRNEKSQEFKKKNSFLENIESENKIDWNLLNSLISAANVFKNRTKNNTCNDLFQGQQIGGLDGYSWKYQGCSKFLLYSMSNNITDMFWPFPFWEKLLKAKNSSCYKYFGFVVKQNETWYLDTYGGRNYKESFKKYSNIIFSNGRYDPTHAASVIEDINESVVSVFMKEGAHGSEMILPPNEIIDPQSIFEGKIKIEEFVKNWIDKHNEENKFVRVNK